MRSRFVAEPTRLTMDLAMGPKLLSNAGKRHNPMQGVTL